MRFVVILGSKYVFEVREVLGVYDDYDVALKEAQEVNKVIDTDKYYTTIEQFHIANSISSGKIKPFLKESE